MVASQARRAVAGGPGPARAQPWAMARPSGLVVGAWLVGGQASEDVVEGVAVDEGEVGPRAQPVHGAVGAVGFEPAGGGGQSLVGGDHLGGGQVAASQGGGAAARLGPGLDPGVVLGPLCAALQRSGQLPGGQLRGAGHHHRLGPHREFVIEGQQFAGEHLRAAQVDHAGGQRRGHLRQPHDRAGQRQQRFRAGLPLVACGTGCWPGAAGAARAAGLSAPGCPGGDRWL